MFPGALGLFCTVDQDNLLSQSCLMAEDRDVSWGCFALWIRTMY